METQEYGKLDALENHYWWHRGRRQMILTLLNQALQRNAAPPELVADIGCGTGSLLEEFKQCGSAVGFDYSSVALQICRQRGIENLVRADAASMPAADNKIDFLTALDVVEHIQDDQRLLTEFQRVLKPGGFVLISVPAHPSLWSGHDLALHHYRRYTSSTLAEVVQQAGFHVERLTYGMLLPLLPALAWRLLFRPWRRPVPGPPGPHDDVSRRAAGYQTDETPVPPWLNSLLLSWLRVEAALLKGFNLPVGLSLLCVARKPPN